MDMFSLIKDLCQKEGVSGDERFFSVYAEKLLKNYCTNTWIDKLGNVFGLIPSKEKNAKRFMIEAHLDRIGLIVKRVDENGFIEFERVGGVDERILPAAEVTVLGKKNIFGVIGAKPPHLRFDGDKNKAPSAKDMLIDVGMTKKEAEKYIKTGDMILLCGEPERLLNNRVCAAALDNRAGMAAVFALLKKTKGKELPYDLYICFSVGEESGLLGAGPASFAVAPDICAVVDVTFGKLYSEDKTPGTFALGGGAVIFRGPDVCYDGCLNLIEKARENNLPFNIEVSGKSSGTNAFAIQSSAGGSYLFLISIPIKYMHQTVETVCLDDISSAGDLLYLLVSGGVKIA